MTQNCPACNKSVDPLRSRFVGVLDGKVVAYCSAECSGDTRRQAPAASSGPVRAARVDPAAARRTPASGVPEVVIRPATPVSGVPISLDSGPVIEIIHEPPSGVVSGARDDRSEPRAKHPDEIAIGAFWTADKVKTGPAPVIAKHAARDDTLDKWATTDSGIARTASETGAATALPPRSKLPLLLVILIVLGAGGFLAYQYLVKRSVAASTMPAPASKPAAAVAAVAAVIEPPRPAEPPRFDTAAAVTRARDSLHGQLTATSQRLTRIAAAALARTGDPAACEILAVQLGLANAATARDVETSDIARLDLAYSLARAGDKRGSAMLAAALGSPRAEARDEAARLLALLGDARGVPRLVDVLAVSQRRLGAAEHLAHLAEPHALKVLDQILADPKASADDKARAVIALGNAGRTDVAPALRDMLSDAHFNAFAAAALAELKDAAARPVLERQLDSPALRVRSARALRRLDPAIPTGPALPRLLALLDGDAGRAARDTDQVQAAEAILLLAGPASWSAFE
jgi:HEAT repeat protein